MTLFAQRHDICMKSIQPFKLNHFLNNKIMYLNKLKSVDSLSATIVLFHLFLFYFLTKQCCVIILIVCCLFRFKMVDHPNEHH
jgi:hypothetical protein